MTLISLSISWGISVRSTGSNRCNDRRRVVAHDEGEEEEMWLQLPDLACFKKGMTQQMRRSPAPATKAGGLPDFLNIAFTISLSCQTQAVRRNIRNN
jgi:hypothetical protein